MFSLPEIVLKILSFFILCVNPSYASLYGGKMHIILYIYINNTYSQFHTRTYCMCLFEIWKIAGNSILDLWLLPHGEVSNRRGRMPRPPGNTCQLSMCELVGCLMTKIVENAFTPFAIIGGEKRIIYWDTIERSYYTIVPF